jgi:preprotein translocase subunit SecD
MKPPRAGTLLPVFGVVVALAGCSGGRDLSGCALAVHAVAEDGSLVEPAALDGDDVLTISRAQEAYGGEVGWEVQLTPGGARINRSFSAEQVGRPVAILCDGEEVARPVVMDESSDNFVFLAAP